VGQGFARRGFSLEDAGAMLIVVRRASSACFSSRSLAERYRRAVGPPAQDASGRSWSTPSWSPSRKPRLPGRMFGIFWQGGEAIVDGIVRTDDHAITRRLLGPVGRGLAQWCSETNGRPR
jgi:hypothetical protein